MPPGSRDGAPSDSWVTRPKAVKTPNTAADPLRRGLLDEVDEKHYPQLLRALLDSAPDAIIVADATGGIVYVNGQAGRLFGYPAAEMIGESIELLVPDRFRGAHPAHRERYMSNPHFRAMGRGLDLYGRRKDGTEIPVEISLSPIPVPGGMLVASAIRDVTERRAADEERRIAAERLQEIERLREEDRFKGKILNVVSHELNTPLTPVKVQLHLLKAAVRKGELERATVALEILDRNVDRFARLVKDILDVSRLEADRLRLNLQDVDVARVAHEAAESFASAPGSDTAPVVWEGAPGVDCTARADPLRVTQVVYNLLANAIRHTHPPGKVFLSVEVETDVVLIRVRDEGSGLTSAQIARLFRPFAQVHTAAEDEGGTGLGLYISQGIAEAHGGTLTCESRGPGKGAAFTLRLPCAGPAQGAAIATTRASDAAAETQAHG